MRKPYQSKRVRNDSKQPRRYKGKKVVDAKTPLRFAVTDNDCKSGVVNNPEHCAGANALRRSLPNLVDVHVHRSVTLLEYPDRVVRYKTSHSVRDQVLRFDAAGKFDPGSYSLKAVTPREIEMRGVQHSPPDRPRGAEDSPYKRKAPVRALGRAHFYFS